MGYCVRNMKNSKRDMEFRWRCAESEGHRGRFSEQVCASRDPGVHTGMGKRLHHH